MLDHLTPVGEVGEHHRIRIAAAFDQGRNVLRPVCAGDQFYPVLVFGLLIGLYRRIAACDLAVRSGGTKNGLVGPELEGKRFGVVGTGAIGSRVAAIANAFGSSSARSAQAISSTRSPSFSRIISSSRSCGTPNGSRMTIFFFLFVWLRALCPCKAVLLLRIL